MQTMFLGETNGTKFSKMDQVKFVEDSLWKIWSGMVCFRQTIPLHFFFKGCLGQILLGPFLNTLTQMPKQNTFRLFWAAERLKTKDLQKWRNFREILRSNADVAYCPVSLPEINIWQ